MHAFDYPQHSRVHRLKSFDTPQCTCWVKRDDELGFGLTGSKVRKYRSLLPFIAAKQFEEVIVIGGVNSNNVLGLSQLLVENAIPFKLYLKGDPSRSLIGNGLLTSLIAGASRIRWISRSEWPNVEAIARAENTGRHIFVVPEGACCTEALPGAMTLAADIHRNEQSVGVAFDHVFVDAGTGLTAIGLIKGFERPCHIHVLLLAEDEAAFRTRLEAFQCSIKAPLSLYRPQTAKSFGATNAQLRKEAQRVAKEEGILLDPLYSAKLFFETRRILSLNPIHGHALVIHSGVGLSALTNLNEINGETVHNHGARKAGAE